MIRRKSPALTSATGQRLVSERVDRVEQDRLRAEVEALRRLAVLQERLFERALGDADLKSLVDTLSHLLGRPVSAVGLGLGPVAISGTAGPPRLGSEVGLTGLSSPIVVDHVAVGHLAVAGNPEGIDLTDRLVLEGAARIVAMLLRRLRANVLAAKQARQQLLADLLSGCVGFNLELLTRGLALGCDLSRPRCLFVVEPLVAGSESGVTEDDLVLALTSALAEHPSIVGAWQGRAVAIVGDGPGSAAKPLAEFDLAGAAERIRAALEQISPAAPPLVEVVPHCPLPFDGRRTIAEAIEILRVARRLGRVKAVIRADDRDLQAYRILAGGQNEVRSDQFVRDVLGRLESHDALRLSRLVETLEAYLEHNGHLEATATALFIHVSTLKYRLSRIAEISGLSLHDPGDRFHAQLALRLHRLGPGDLIVRSS